MTGRPLFAPKDLFDRMIFLMGAVMWPNIIPLMMRQGEYVVSCILAVWTLIAWIHTVRWVAGWLKGKIL